ncbi:hypothetical protein PVIIG_05460 [Plasmodium vivax India VII]|uniref:Uncharacterized protein n=1 Tax=Plasmodium vivax India VII TaxID=1077284 RepID=A0A0J9S1I9_PLAVI|nr:hypothetical protein PVIIG_05460 [Plasmodium vivax India VII]
MGEFSSEAFKKIYDKFKTEYDHPSLYHPILYELITYTGDDGVFIKADTRIACNYINYILNDNLRNKKHIYDNISHYNIYKDFVKDEYIERHKGYHHGKSCDIYINEISKDIFQRMSILYRLYDEYNDLKKTNQRYNSVECDKLSKFARLFNDTASNHAKDDDELLTRLTDLKKLTQEKLSSPYYNTCNTKITFFHLPERSSKVQEKQYEAPSLGKEQQEQGLKSQDILTKTQETLTALSKMSNVQEEPEILAIETSSRESETVTKLKESHHPVQSASLKPLESERETINYESRTPHTSGIPHVSETHVSENSHESGHSYLSESSNKSESFHRLGHSHVLRPEDIYPLTEEEKGNTFGGIYSPVYPRSNPAVKEGGVSGILSSISGVLGDVDPVPVVGVSEEDEDAHIESLVVSMDNSQDFQIITNMMVGILDIVQ